MSQVKFNKTKTVRKHNLSTMKKVLNDDNLKRKTFAEYKVMKKKDLYRAMVSFIANFDNNRHKIVVLQLENNFLNRKVSLLEEQIALLTYDSKRNFKNLSKMRKKAHMIQKERLLNEEVYE